MSRPRVRIILRPTVDLPGFPMVCGVLPSWGDLRVVVVTPAGEEFDLPFIRGIKFDASDETALEPVEVTLRIIPDEIDVECFAKVEP